MSSSTSRTRFRVPKSCLQCRRRHQKCIPSVDGPCQNCLRRYPPVECVGLRDPKSTAWSISTLPIRSDKATIQPSTPTKILMEKRRVIAETPKIFGGILTEMTTLHGMPIESSLRIAELAHLFNQYVVPNYVSIDGQNLPLMFKTHILPWMIQSPLMPNIAILMASYSERLERGIQGGEVRDRETLVIKSHVLGLVKKFLEGEFAEIADECIRAVTHLVILEWWWGNEQSLWAHMKGIREMVRILGGLENLSDPTLTHVLTLTDIELACCYERPLFFDYPPASPSPSSSPTTPPTPSPPISSHLASPLYPSPTTFRKTASTLGITIRAAEILDDVRFLTLSITSPSSKTLALKIKSTARWLSERLSALPSSSSLSSSSSSSSSSSTSPQASSPMKREENQIEEENKVIETTIHHAAMVYTSSIATFTPFSTPSKSSLLHIVRIKEGIKKVGMGRWKEIPGIFLWILIVICPGLDPPPPSRKFHYSDGEEEGGEGDESTWEGATKREISEEEDRENRGLRKRMAVTGMAIGLEGFGLGIEFMSAGFGVQRWIALQRGVNEDRSDDLGGIGGGVITPPSV